MNKEIKKLLLMVTVFLSVYFLPLTNDRFRDAIYQALALAKWYAQEHVILCLIPAFFIAGVISVFISQASVIRYLGAGAKKWAAYMVASVSGTILAVCSCTILPLFAGIYKRGAGLGPAIAFLYSGPAINIMAIILTARILGLEMGIARIIGAVSFSIIIGLIMEFIYRKEDKSANSTVDVSAEKEPRALWQTAFHFFVLVAILVFVNFGKSVDNSGVWHFLWFYKWQITSVLGLLFGVSLVKVLKIPFIHVLIAALPVVAAAIFAGKYPVLAFTIAVASTSILLSTKEGEPKEWLASTWSFAKQILPLLAAGVLVAGFLLGAPGSGEALIPKAWISNMVGGNSVFANFFASIVGAFMYFATLTEVPILQGLIAGGMGKGPALALLLAGPALSLPNMLVIKSVIGVQKTVVFVSLVVIMATVTGLLYGYFF